MQRPVLIVGIVGIVVVVATFVFVLDRYLLFANPAQVIVALWVLGWVATTAIRALHNGSHDI